MLTKRDDDAVPFAAIDRVAATSGETPEAGPVSPAVAAYLTFAQAPAPAEIPPSHDYAADRIRSLAAALETIAASEPMRERIQTLRVAADRIQQDPQSLQQADHVRGVFISAIDVMAAVHQDRLPTSDALRQQIGETRQAAEAVQADQPLLQQKKRVKAFFDRAGDVCRTLSAPG
jgi:hypothetical protein